MVIEESLKEFYRANHLNEHWMGIAIADNRLKVWTMRLIPKSLRDLAQNPRRSSLNHRVRHRPC